MSEASPNNFEGGHTWRPRIEVCQECHGPVNSFFDIRASGDYNGDGTVGTAFEELGTINPDSGLFGQVRAALQSKGIFYNPDAHPYFFTSAAFTTQFRAWTTNTLSAAFNLSYAYKAGNCVYVHNAPYIAQVLLDSLQVLGVTNPGFQNRPAGNRNARDYRTIVINP